MHITITIWYITLQVNMMLLLIMVPGTNLANAALDTLLPFSLPSLPPLPCPSSTLEMPNNPSNSQYKGKTWDANLPKTPSTNSSGLDELTTSPLVLGLIKNVDEAKNFLKQRALIAINENYTAVTLANILFNTVLKNKLSTIRAVGFLIISKLAENTSMEISSTVTDQLMMLNQTITNKLNQECEFIKATTANQTRHIPQLSESITKLNLSINNLDTTNQFITAITKDIQPLTQTFNKTKLYTTSLITSTKELSKIADDLKNLLAIPPNSSNSQPLQPSYANTVTNLTSKNVHPPLPHFDPSQPDHINHITNRLLIAEKQLYITYNPNDNMAPKTKTTLQPSNSK